MAEMKYNKGNHLYCKCGNPLFDEEDEIFRLEQELSKSKEVISLNRWELSAKQREIERLKNKLCSCLLDKDYLEKQLADIKNKIRITNGGRRWNYFKEDCIQITYKNEKKFSVMVAVQHLIDEHMEKEEREVD